MNVEASEPREPVTARETLRRLPATPRPPGLPYISWGAVLAGAFVVLALGWLIQLLGLALGVSIADATNSVTMNGALKPAVSIWILVCWLVTFFVGALVTARLAGRIDDTSGMLHGFTLWAVATVISVVLGYYGLMAFLETGQRILGAAAQGVGSVASAAATGVGQVASGAAGVTEQIAQQYGDQIQQRLYDQAAVLASQSSEQLTPQQVRRAISDLDARTLRRIVIDLSNRDIEGATELLTQKTRLPREDAESLAESTYQSLEQEFGDPQNNQSLAQDVKDQLIQKVDSYLASLDQPGGPEVTQQDIRQALNQLDAQAAQQLGSHLLNGDTAGAKRVLVRNTILSQAQIDELVDGATATIDEEITSYKQAVDEALEKASTYTASVLWLIFGGSAAALAAALAGGYIGADSSRRLYPSDYESDETVARAS